MANVRKYTRNNEGTVTAVNMTSPVLVIAFGHRAYSKWVHLGEMVAVPGAGGTYHPKVVSIDAARGTFTDDTGAVHRVTSMLE